MTPSATGKKGFKTEEVVRAYFLRAGFFVVRGIPFRHASVDLTDIDIWIYERSATLARRRTIVDVKDRKTPQAAERLFFIKGLAEITGVEGAGVATPDSRAGLRELAKKHGVLWIDGSDIQRLKSSDALTNQARLTEEELNELLAALDSGRGSKHFRDNLDFMKSALADRFGAASANAAIECFRASAQEAVKAYPASSSAVTISRTCYLAAAFAAVGLDFVSAETALRPSSERVKHMADAIRLGADAEGAYANLRWAETAIREYLPNGASLAQTVRSKFESQIRSIPSDGFAEIVVKLSSSDRLFSIAKQLEQAAYARQFLRFDELDADSKAFVGALLDFVSIRRDQFADAAKPSTNSKSQADPEESPETHVLKKESRKDGRLL